MRPLDLNISRLGRRVSVGVFNDDGPEFMFTIGEEPDWESDVEPEARQACLDHAQCQLLVAFWQSGRRSIRLREKNVNSPSTLLVARHSSGDGFRASATERYREDGGDNTQSFDLTAREMRRIIKKALLFCWVFRNLKADQRRLAAVRSEMKKVEAKSRKLELEELRISKSIERLLTEAR